MDIKQKIKEILVVFAYDEGEDLMETHASLIEDFINRNFIPKKKIKIDCSEWIDEWLNLFPKGVTTGGKLVRSDRRECIKKMNAFLENYEYDVSTIILATRRYINMAEREDWHIKCAVYFIHKRDEGSSLAEWCEKYLTEKSKVDEEMFKEEFI